MKVRTFFVSNSSSSSFIVHINTNEEDEFLQFKINSIIDNAATDVLFDIISFPTSSTYRICYFSRDKSIPTDIETTYGFVTRQGTGWYKIKLTDNKILLETSMDNFDMLAYLKNKLQNEPVEFIYGLDYQGNPDAGIKS